MKRRLYCSLRFCENFKGTQDANVQMFKYPPRGSDRRAKFQVCLAPYVDEKELDKIVWICQLHFRPEDIRKVRSRKQQTLKQTALPQPPSTEIFRVDTFSNYAMVEDEKPNVELIDIHEITGDTSTAYSMDTDHTANSLKQPQKSQVCAECVQYEIKLLIVNEKLEKLQSKYEDVLAENKVLRGKIGLSRKSSVNMLAESRIQNENSNGLLAVETENIVPIELENPIEIKEDPIAVCLEMEELSDQMPQLILGELANVVNKFYKCGYCGEAFESAKLLGCHFQDTHAKSNYEPKITKIEQFECYICKAKWKTFEELRDHMIHHERNHKCEICNESLSVIELKSHLCGNERTIDCEYCDKKCTAIVDLMKHLKGMHENQRLYRCNQCPKFFPMMILKEYHIMNHVEVAKPFACETCLKCFAQKLSLTNHMKRHNAEKRHLCEECGKSFPSAMYLKRHKLSAIHTEAQLQCPDCPKKFSRPKELKRHSNMHQESLPTYVCEICGREVSSLDAYNQHKRKHRRTEADRRFACTLCPLRFFSKATLNKHQAVHTGLKPFTCQFCEQSYKYKGDLNKHLKIHLDGKIHKCPKCPMRFQYPLELQRHLFEHYKEEKQKTHLIE